jgi:hypothetical protein
VDVDVSVPEDLQVQLETLQAEYRQMADSLLQEQTRNKYLQNEVWCKFFDNTAISLRYFDVSNLTVNG